MFKSFVDTINDWLEKQNLTLAAGLCAGLKLDFSESAPLLNEIKRHFIRSIIPPYYTRFFFHHSIHLEHLLVEVFSFSSYLNENKIRNRVDSSMLSQLPESEKDKLCLKLLAFMQQQNNWNDGTWHRALLENQQVAFDIIAAKLQLDDPWQCASFLAGCGYLIPYSADAARGWDKWSGQSTSVDSLKSWWRQLAEVSPARTAVFKLDRLLDSLFNPDCTILEKPFCMDSTVCRICPLSGSCRFLATTINPDRTRESVNHARTGDLKNLSMEDLVLLMAGEAWNGTEFQKNLVADFPNLSPWLSAEAQSPAEELMLVKLLAIKEISARIKDITSEFTGKSFTCASDIFDHFKHKLGNETQESFYTVILDNKHRIIATRLISLGTLNQSLVHPREVFAPAIQLRAAAIILVHNHPSGDPTPSNQDIAITQRLQDVGEIVGIKVLDHVIIGSQRFFSFIDENLIKS